MHEKYDSELRLNQYGEPDVNYYIAQASVIRGKMLAQMMVGIAQWLKRRIKIARTSSLQEIYGR